MLAVVALIRLVLPEEWHHGLRLAVQSSAGALTYAGVMLLMFGDRVREMYRVVFGAGQQGLDKNDDVTKGPPVALDPHS